MSAEYDFEKIEPKWQNKWETNLSHNTNLSNNGNKHYCLTMFSYPSGDKLHIGHWYNYGPVDSYARFLKMNGNNVFQPQGFDAFGLPAENYAIKHGVHPAISTSKNVDKMKQQLKRIGAMFDWINEVNTSSPDYYKWTQWLFLQLYKNKLAYRENAPVNWCPSCSTVLANEQVKDGLCDRCDSEVSKRDLTQWFFKITNYSDELLSSLDTLDWPEKTKHMQKNWIGKSIGANVVFTTESNEKIKIFTTRPDTIYGSTYLVIAPEHPLVNILKTDSYSKDVTKYVAETRNKTEIERMADDGVKTGVFTGSYAINPFTNKKIPIWVADYVIASYGTGAVMAVPGSDLRDYEFAKKYDLEIIEVVSKDGKISKSEIECFTDYGIAVNSEGYTGLESSKLIPLISNKISEMGIGEATVQYRLHDWLVSRQRYWGAPIPIIHCENCGSVPVPEKDLPVLLPDNIQFSSTYGDDISPLATVDSYIKTNCPECKREAKRDSDTMDTFVCSSWYYLRYPNSSYEEGPFDTSLLNWLPVDTYVGGAEHATMHLLYARFITKVLRDLGHLSFDEPFLKLYHQGTITKDGSKMSKSKGNTVSPDDFIDKYGSDTFRSYLMFMGPYDEGGDWNDKGITGINRFLRKVWKICVQLKSSNVIVEEDEKVIHKTIKQITYDLNNMKFNTAISRLMEYVNVFSGRDSVHPEVKSSLVLLLAPFAPHISEEIWESLGNTESIFDSKWPEYIESKTKDKSLIIIVQVNGKLRGKVEVDSDISKEDLLKASKNLDNVKVFIDGKDIVKEIVVPKKLVNFVVK